MPKPNGKQKIMAKYTKLVAQRLYKKEIFVFFADFRSLSKAGNLKEELKQEKEHWIANRKEFRRVGGDLEFYDEVHLKMVEAIKYGHSADFAMLKGLHQKIAYETCDKDIQLADYHKTKVWKNAITFNSVYYQENKLDYGAWNSIVHEVTHEKIPAIQNKENEHTDTFWNEFELNNKKVKNLKKQFDEELAYN